MFRALLIFLTLFLVTCTLGPNNIPSLAIIRAEDFARPDDFYERLKQVDENRNEILENSKRTHVSSICSESEDCQKICRNLFNRSDDREDCEDLTEAQVDRLDDVHDALESPGLNDLQYIDLYDLNVFLNVSPEPIERLFRRIGSSRARSILYWIASDKDVAEIFESEDGEFVILETLLDEIRPRPEEALGVSVREGDTFQEVAIESDNRAAFDWTHNFLVSECSSSGRSRGNEEEWCVLAHYCNITKRFSEDNQADFLEFAEIAGIVIDVIENPPGDDSRRYRGIEDIDDVLDLERDICVHFCASREITEC